MCKDCLAKDAPRLTLPGRAGFLDYDIVENIPNGLGNGYHYFKVLFRPTLDDLKILGSKGIHSNIFLSQTPNNIERCIVDYWERKLNAAAQGKPYPQRHMKTTLNLSVSNGDNDAAEDSDNTDFNRTNTQDDLWSATTAAFQRSGGYRFQNVTIPNAAVINSAVLKLECMDASIDNMNTLIYCEDVDDA